MDERVLLLAPRHPMGWGVFHHEWARPKCPLHAVNKESLIHARRFLAETRGSERCTFMDCELLK